LYIDQLNQDYDNPILRKELVALSTKEKTRSCERNYLKADRSSETNDKDVFFYFILNYLPSIGLLLSCSQQCLLLLANALPSTTTIDIYNGI
jgi:hypothetical protein